MMSRRPGPAVASDPPALDSDDAIWRALADPSRRLILDLLRRRSMTTGELCACFEFSRFAVMKHLKALEKSALVIVERRGRTRINHLNPVPIQAIYRRWIRPFDRLGADRLLKLKAVVETDKEKR
jgi:DNA-binding transcriptional ArsR family regulator